jgi:hypothetical protein
MVAVAIVGAGFATAVGSVASGAVASKGAQQAASTEANAQLQAAKIQQQMAEQAQAIEAPYVGFGTTAGQQLTNELQSGALGAPAPLDNNTIANMPGYQFTLQQGLLSTQNAAAAQGLGVSGAALKGAASYATGLASTNFQNYFSDYWANQNNRYNMLANTMNTGANAGAQLGSQLVQSGSNQANQLNTSAANIGTAQQNAANASAAGVQGLGSGVSNALLANALLGQTQGGSTVTPSQIQAGATAQQNYFMNQPAGTYGPGL